MPQNVYARVAARGFPVANISGQSGQGALQDSTAPPQVVGQPNASWSDPNADPGYEQTAMPTPEEYQLGLSLWGLGGEINPDNTPRTHAAPIADPTLPIGEYYAEADATHADEFTGTLLTNPGSGQSWVGDSYEMQYERSLIPGSDQTLQASVPDQLKSLNGFDAVQGFGGGGDGPGGTNADMPLMYQDAEFPGPEGNPVFISPAEVPFIVPSADQFIPTDPALGTWASPYDAPTTNVQQQQSVGTDSPAQGAPLSSVPMYSGSFWGG